MTRRQLLAAPLAAIPVRAGQRIGRSRLSAVTDEIARTPADAIAFARQYGLEWLELRSVPGSRREYFTLPEAEARAVAAEFRAAGIRISFLNSSMLKYPLPGTTLANPRARTESPRFDKRLEELKQAIGVAHILGVDKIRIFTFTRTQEPEKLVERLAEIIGPLARVAEKEKVQLLVENEGSTNTATCGETAALLKLVPSRALGVNWDPLNGIRFPEKPFPDGYRLLPMKRLGNVQVKGKSLLPGPELMDWATILRTLAKDGYRGQVGLETHIFGDGQIQASHDSIREMLRLVEAS